MRENACFLPFRAVFNSVEGSSLKTLGWSSPERRFQVDFNFGFQ
ncbi:hypothetical protein LEP1GSC062_2270 [Leptospira alexanderi serovar Manhao 3 str. L 60]|uniref:Uncharacterized protein n=1 Tax=Leptospira alexanderi serovar Manhao 3 str. L 60 TaxID=1049759 RepID=V6IGD8_9LEPT|nr:hypothetical protein LEP1GSC062_2270 [Leptospira alexanderi serovar Manhao 3 str. L 60]